MDVKDKCEDVLAELKELRVELYITTCIIGLTVSLGVFFLMMH